jgi:hypothetical protein
VTERALTRDEPEPRLVLWHALGVLVVTRLVLGFVLSRAGLFALSDDDFSRVVIAQSFAVHPRLDPSGTSWLPFPFFCMGGAMRLFGSSLPVARIATEVIAVLSSLLLFAAGVSIGLGRGRALAGAWLATVLPASAVLASVPLPEWPTAALSAFALLAVSSDRPRMALFASLAVVAASLSRYEAWPVALAVACALLSKKRFWLVPVALAGPLVWLFHNRLAHGDALHFLRRVSAYQAALGEPLGALSYVRALGTSAPVLVATAVMLAVLSARLWPPGARTAPFAAWAAPLGGVVLLLVFLTAGAAMGGAPTHHVGRTLLLVWVLSAIAVVDLAASARRGVQTIVVALVAFEAFLGFGRELEGTLDRRDEVWVGTELGRRMAPGDRVLVATTDYGYFAVQAALGRPDAVVVDRTHDPRAVGEASSLRDAPLLLSRMDREGAGWLVAPGDVRVSGLLPALTHGRLSVYRRP